MGGFNLYKHTAHRSRPACTAVRSERPSLTLSYFYNDKIWVNSSDQLRLLCSTKNDYVIHKWNILDNPQIYIPLYLVFIPA